MVISTAPSVDEERYLTKNLEEVDKAKLFKMLKVSEEIRSKKLVCYSIKEKVDDYSLDMFESCSKFEILILELDVKYMQNLDKISHKFGAIIHPLVSSLSDLSIVYQDLSCLYSDLILSFSIDSSKFGEQDSSHVESTKCIRSLVTSSLSVMDLDEFKKNLENIYRELYTVHQASLNKVKEWISTIIHHLDTLELKYQSLISDLVEI